MANLTGKDFSDLERLIDKSSVRSVVHAIGVVCGEKSAHIWENWQDEPLALLWAREGEKIERFAAKVRI
jgi:hypothetical protein